MFVEDLIKLFVEDIDGRPESLFDNILEILRQQILK